MPNYDSKSPCPCHSGASYGDCCRPWHSGERPATALQLMRSRYAAYSLALAEYIMATIHRDNPSWTAEIAPWRSGILEFCSSTDFTGLDILDFSENGDEAFVTFTAHLRQGEHDATFTERSRFVREGELWKYHSGTISKQKEV